ncbi:MAG: hypothetical protein ACOC8E_02745 [Planctomycetota bacterium]
MGPMRNVSAAGVEPTARLKVVETTTLWKSPDGKVSARLARFSPDKRRLAWCTADGSVFTHDLKTGKTAVVDKGGGEAGVGGLTWSATNDLAWCVRSDPETRYASFKSWTRGTGGCIADAGGAMRVAWRADSKALAFSTKTKLELYDFDVTIKEPRLLDQQKGWRPKGAAAYEDLVFVGDRVAARAAGTMKWWLAGRKKKAIALGELRGLCPDPKRNRLFAVAWQAGPVGIPRGCGVVCFDLSETPLKRTTIVPFDHIGDEPYWLVDIWNAAYPTTLRISPDGKTLTFCGVKAGALSENAWREFCIWRVPSDGSEPPAAVAKCGPIFKRIDVGDTHFIGWRYKIDKAIVLGDLTRGVVWRLPDDFYVQRVNTDVLVDRLLVGAARGKDVVLMQLAEEK